MQKRFLIIVGISGALAVAIGAFGAHALSDILELTNRKDTFETAVKYHFYHTFALFIVAMLMERYPGKAMLYAARSFGFGIIIFSGSLYILCITGQRFWAALTPFGGLLFIVGWVALAIGAMRGK